MNDLNSSIVHHIEVCVGDESAILKILSSGFGFKISYYRSTKNSVQWGLTSGNIAFIITKRIKHSSTNSNLLSEQYGEHQTVCNSVQKDEFKQIDNNVIEQNSYPVLFCRCIGDNHPIDSVFNVALSVKNVEEATAKVKSKGGKVIREPCIIQDEHGIIKMSIVASECENVVHSLLDKSKYKGTFLPGFTTIESSSSKIYHKMNERVKLFTKYIDHVTYVCSPGQSKKIIQWYEDCFGMKRFFSNR